LIGRKVTAISVIVLFILSCAYDHAYALPGSERSDSTLAALIDPNGTKDPELWADDPKKVWLNGLADKEQTILKAVYEIADTIAKEHGRADGVNFALVHGLIRTKQLEEYVEFKYTYDMLAAALLLPLRADEKVWKIVLSRLSASKIIPTENRRSVLAAVERQEKIESMIERLEQFNVYEICGAQIIKRDDVKTKKKVTVGDTRREQDYFAYIMQSIRDASTKDKLIQGNDLLLFLTTELSRMHHFYKAYGEPPNDIRLRASYDHLLYRAETIYQKICEDLMMQQFASRFKERAFEIRYKHDPSVREKADVELKYFISAKLSQYKDTRLFTKDGDLVFPFNHDDVRAIILRPLEKQMREYLAENGIKTGYRIESRSKNVGSILAKMEGRDYDKEDVGDLFALRVIFDKPEDKEHFQSLNFEPFGLLSDMRPYRKEEKGVEFTNINVSTRYFGSSDFTEEEFKDYGYSVARLVRMISEKYVEKKGHALSLRQTVEGLNTLISIADLAFDFNKEISVALANKALSKKIHPELRELFEAYNRNYNEFKREKVEKKRLLNRMIIELLFEGECPRDSYFHKYEFQCVTAAEYQGYFRGKGAHNAYKATLRKQAHDLGPTMMSADFYKDLAVILAGRDEYVMVILDRSDATGIKAELLRLREEYFPCGVNVLANPAITDDVFDPGRKAGLKEYDFKQRSYHPYSFHERGRISGGGVLMLDKSKGLNSLKTSDIANIINQRQTLAPRSLLMLNLLHEELKKQENNKGHYSDKENIVRRKSYVSFGKQRLEMRQFDLTPYHPDQEFINFICGKFNFKEPDELYAALHFQVRSTLQNYLIDELAIERIGWRALLKLCAAEKGFEVKRIEKKKSSKKKKGKNKEAAIEEVPLVPIREFKLFLAEIEQVIPQLYYDGKIEKPHFRHLLFSLGQKKLPLETVKEYLRKMVVTGRQEQSGGLDAEFLLSA
jgi:hypothetical protein